MPIPAEHQDKLVDAGLHFLRALSDAYGNERALEFWSTLSDTIDPDLKGLTFSAMLTGRLGQLLTITGVVGTFNKVSLVKAIRTWDRRNLGLKEALDMLNPLLDNNKAMRLEIDYSVLEQAKSEFKRLGCIGVGF